MATTKLLTQIRNSARKAATLRLNGKIVNAGQEDNFVDSLVRSAEREGMGDAAFMAEEAGRELASRAYHAKKSR